MEPAKTKKAIWLDCDPGLDDTFAILLAAYHPDLELIGISCAEGNTTIENTTMNACRILWSSGIDNVPVVQGIRGPLIKDELFDDGILEESQEIHGKDGLGTRDGDSLPKDVPLKPENVNPITYMYEKIKKHPSKVHLVATGSQTNISLLFTVFPDVLDNIEQFVFMGGAIDFGNISPAAEANIRFDPEAAEIVLKKRGIKKAMVPLEVTHMALVTDEVQDKIKALGTRYSKIMLGMLLFYRDAYHSVYDWEFSPLHDPCAIAYVIDPTIFASKHIRVDVEVSGLCRGRTVCDLYNKTKQKPNCHVTTKINVAKFWELMLPAIEKANSNNRVEETK